MPRGGGMRSGTLKGSSWGRPNPKPLKPRGRNVGQAGFAGLAPRRSQHLRASGRRSRPRPTTSVSEPPGGRTGPRDLLRPPTEPAPARAPGDSDADLQLPARACRTRHRNVRRKASFGAHTPVRVGSAARLAPFLFRRRIGGAPGPPRRLFHPRHSFASCGEPLRL